MTSPSEIDLSPGPKPRTTTNVAIRIIATALAVLVAASCSVQADTAVQPLGIEDEAALRLGTSTTTSTVPGEETGIFLLYFVLDDQLELVRREYPIDPAPPLGRLLADLSESPTEEEREPFVELGQLRSQVPPNLDAQVELDEDTGIGAIVVAAEGAEAITTSSTDVSVLIVSQLVCTVLNNTPKVDKVEIYQRDSEGATVQLDLFNRNVELIPGGRATAADFNDCETGTDIRLAEAEAEAEAGSTTEG